MLYSDFVGKLSRFVFLQRPLFSFFGLNFLYSLICLLRFLYGTKFLSNPFPYWTCMVLSLFSYSSFIFIVFLHWLRSLFHYFFPSPTYITTSFISFLFISSTWIATSLHFSFFAPLFQLFLYIFFAHPFMHINIFLLCCNFSYLYRLSVFTFKDLVNLIEYT